jgi:hypothetical protein
MNKEKERNVQHGQGQSVSCFLDCSLDVFDGSDESIVVCRGWKYNINTRAISTDKKSLIQ